MPRKVKKHRELIQYLKHTIHWLEEQNPEGPDNEIILLNLIRELQAESPVQVAILRERIYHIAKLTEEQANPKWGNPLMHWTQFKNWATKVITLIDKS